MDINDFPWRPSLCITLSITKAALARYPLSSSNERAKNIANIGGTNTRTDPTPENTASEIKDANISFDMLLFASSPSQPKNISIISENGAENENVN